MSSRGERLESATVSELERGAGTNLRTVDVKSEAFRELVSSVKTHGILEPVLARREKGRLILVAGFRRVAAAKASGRRDVPVRVLGIESSEVVEVQLLENIQREGLTPLQEARAMKSYLDSAKTTQEQLGKRIGKSQSYVAHRIRLLGLPEAGVRLLESGKITASAAEHLVSLPPEAGREVKHAISEMERRASYGRTVTVESVRDVVDSARRSFQDRRLREKAIATAKFPTCPVKGCGKKGLYRQWSDDLRCSDGHEWNPKTGRVSAGERRDTESRHSPPPKPTLPIVDWKVPIDAPATVIAKRILEAMKDPGSVQVSWILGTRAELLITAELPSLKAAKVPNISVVSRHKFVELPDAAYAQRDDVGRRQAAEDRANLESWLATVRGVGRPAHKDPAPAPAAAEPPVPPKGSTAGLERPASPT